jgi:hypothetical protein
MSNITLRHNGIFQWSHVSEKSEQILSSVLTKKWEDYTNEGGGETVIGRCTYLTKNEKEYKDILEVYIKCLDEYAAENKLDLTYKNLDSQAWLFREYLPGTTMSAHIDGYGYAKDNGEFVVPELTILFYINDNYEGGEIVFPEEGLSIKPKANSVIVFPSNKMHSVSEVLSGKRYMTQTYIYKDHYDKYDSVFN